MSDSHYEISPGEREDEERLDAYDFGVQEFADQELRDRILRSGEWPQEESS